MCWSSRFGKWWKGWNSLCKSVIRHSGVNRWSSETQVHGVNQWSRETHVYRVNHSTRETYAGDVNH